ncbi:MAG: YggS family pyridoxal phosphate-dependent enzyme [Planctomycetota bacterium]|nr:YggS family pyridoxal phosphate-dependent enzyme [Planctomycetota bacterium]
MKRSLLALDMPIFEENWHRLRDQIRDLTPTGSDAARILPVTKYLDRDDARQILDGGYGPLGENRADQLVERTDPGQDPDGWHFIGRLQRNKIRDVAPRISLFHSLDSERLATALDSWVDVHLSAPLRVLVQINIAGESRKAGIDLVLAADLILSWIDQFPSLRFCGLMTMAPDWPSEQCRPVFRALRELRTAIQDQLPAPSAPQFEHLSMGMSGDWKVAVEEGATLIRIGRALYRSPEEED